MSFLKGSFAHFKQLERPARLLLLSIVLFSLANPFLRTFINAFILRQSNSISLVGLYNLGIALGLPIAFFLNGLFLKRFKPNILYLLGAVLQGVALIPLFFSPGISPNFVFIPGFLFGLSFGLYWSNRNLLTLKVTKSENRNYFSGTEISISTVINVVVPLLIGWFIILGERNQTYNPGEAYRLLMLLTTFILIISGLSVRKINVRARKMESFPSFKFGPYWRKVQIISFGNGVADGASWFLPIIMVMLLVGKEGAVGTMTSFAAVLAALAIYLVSKKAKVKDRLLVLAIGLFLEVIAAVLFAFIFSYAGVVLYYALHAFAIPFIWASLNPIIMDVIDRETTGSQPTNQYNYIFNRELFKDLGVISGTGWFLIFTKLTSSWISLRFTPALLALVQISILLVAHSLVKQMKLTHQG